MVFYECNILATASDCPLVTEWEALALLGPLTLSETVCSSEYRMTDKVRDFSNPPNCHTPLSEST
jgi:hypothetical protein